MHASRQEESTYKKKLCFIIIYCEVIQIESSILQHASHCTDKSVSALWPKFLFTNINLWTYFGMPFTLTTLRFIQRIYKGPHEKSNPLTITLSVTPQLVSFEHLDLLIFKWTPDNLEHEPIIQIENVP